MLREMTVGPARLRRGVALFGFLLMLQPLAHAADTAALSGSDPLSAAEESAATKAAQADARVADLLAHTTHAEPLFVERHDEGKAAGSARRADVYIYLYDTDRLLYAVVNLATSAVDSLTAQQNVQLPPTDNENATAVNLALASPTAGKAIRKEYSRVTDGKTLNTADQLTFKALVFRADSHPAAAKATDAGACGVHRCLQILLTTSDGTLINVMPIVDLSRGAVLGTVPFVEP